MHRYEWGSAAEVIKRDRARRIRAKLGGESGVKKAAEEAFQLALQLERLYKERAG